MCAFGPNGTLFHTEHCVRIERDVRGRPDRERRFRNARNQPDAQCRGRCLAPSVMIANPMTPGMLGRAEATTVGWIGKRLLGQLPCGHDGFRDES